jgi:hypothetical protein
MVVVSAPVRDARDPLAYAADHSGTVATAGLLTLVMGLSLAFIPVALYGLELMLNAVQALIFSVLTLMFILAAIEGHHDEHEAEHADEPVATPVGIDDLDQVVAPAH